MFFIYISKDLRQVAKFGGQPNFVLLIILFLIGMAFFFKMYLGSYTFIETSKFRIIKHIFNNSNQSTAQVKFILPENKIN